MDKSRAHGVCFAVVAHHNAHFAKHSHNTIRGRSVSVHGGALRVAAELPLRRGADGPAAGRVTTATTGGAALLQGQKLLGTEGLVVDLAGCLDQVLQVSAGKEVAQVNKLAVVLILDVDNTPAVLAAANLLAIHDDGLLTADNGERNDILDLMLDEPGDWSNMVLP